MTPPTCQQSESHIACALERTACRRCCLVFPWEKLMAHGARLVAYTLELHIFNMVEWRAGGEVLICWIIISVSSPTHITRPHNTVSSQWFAYLSISSCAPLRCLVYALIAASAAAGACASVCTALLAVMRCTHTSLASPRRNSEDWGGRAAAAGRHNPSVVPLGIYQPTTFFHCCPANVVAELPCCITQPFAVFF